MRVTAMEDAMNRNTAFPPRLKLTQCNNIINGFVWFGDCPSVDDVAQHFQKAIDAHKRFRAVPRGMKWEPVDTNARDHVRCHEAATEEAAFKLLFDIANYQELPQDRPLWRVEIAKVPVGRSIAMVRVHHVIGDGIGLFEHVFPLIGTDLNGGPLNVSMGPMPKQTGGLLSNILWYLDAVRSFVRVMASSAYALETDLPCSDPNRASLEYSGKREVVFFPPMSLEYIKRVKDAAKCTVNDVMYSAWAGAVRRHCEARGFVFDKEVTLRTLLPVVVPRVFPPDHDPQDRLVNYFTFVPINMDVNAKDLEKRLKSNKRNLDVVKKTTVALVSLWAVNNLTPKLPAFMQQDTAQKVFSRHSLVFSNVPGPKTGLRLFGKAVDEMQAVFINVIPQVIAMSIGGKVSMNLVADPEVITPLQDLPRHYLDELDAMGKAFGVSGTCRYKA
jgi:hypothetical protein